MIIKSLRLENFRNIKEAELYPTEEMNVICGENAQGKTNLLEAIWLFTGAKSFRGAKDNEMVKFDTKKASLSLNFIGEGIEKEGKIEIEEKRKAYLNEKPLKNPSKLAGCFNAIVFSPLDLRLVSDGPTLRRKFIDTAICQLYPTYIEILRSYTKAVAQRNKVLKDFKYNSSLKEMLVIFEEEIAEKGEKIVKYRKRYLEVLKEFLPQIYYGLSSGKEELVTDYLSTTEENLKIALEKSREKDMLAGITTVGPHRDDLIFLINGQNARSFGSQGQKRSVALSLKLAEAEVIKKNVLECPVCLLDDIMSELDPSRQEYILNHIKGMQTFLSCCDPQNVSSLKEGKRFTVKEGKFS